jgi:hypothetical protein
MKHESLEIVKGSGFEEEGVEIDLNLLASTLHGHKTLILDPGRITGTLYYV